MASLAKEGVKQASFATKQESVRTNIFIANRNADQHGENDGHWTRNRA